MSEPWKMEKLNLCRCCHSEGKAYQSIYSKSMWLGDEEVAYIKILHECFDIELAPVSEVVQELLCNICEECISRLRDATLFKHQVMKCEGMFRKIYTDEQSEDVDIKNEKVEDSEEERTEIEITPIVQKGSKRSKRDGAGASQTFKQLNDQSSDDDYLDELTFDDDPEPEPEPPKVEQPKTTKRKYTKRNPAKKNATKTTKTTKKTAKETKEDQKEDEGILESRLKAGKRPSIYLKEDVDYRRVVRTTGPGVDLQCCRCNKQWDEKLYCSMQNHIKSKHFGIFRHKCKHCNKSFASRGPHIKHLFEEHNIDERLKCNACDKIYNNRSHLTDHYKSFHMLGNKLKCNECEYETYSLVRLKRHSISHKTEKTFHCSYCNKAFPRKTTLQFHIRIHTGDKRKVCKVCGQAFVQKASLNWHMAKYHPGVEF